MYALHFKFDRDLMELSQKHGALWSYSKRLWYYKKSSITLDKISSIYKGNAILDIENFENDILPTATNIALKEKLSTDQKNHLNKFMFTYEERDLAKVRLIPIHF